MELGLQSYLTLEEEGIPILEEEEEGIPILEEEEGIPILGEEEEGISILGEEEEGISILGEEGRLKLHTTRVHINCQEKQTILPTGLQIPTTWEPINCPLQGVGGDPALGMEAHPSSYSNQARFLLILKQMYDRIIVSISFYKMEF